MTLASTLLALLPCALPAATEDHRPAMRKAAELLIKAEGNFDKLLFTRRRETRQLESGGAIKSKEIITVRREPYEDLIIMRTIARDDKPLSPEELKSQEDDIRRSVAVYRERLAKQGPPKPTPKKEEDHFALIREFPDALDFTFTGPETFHGRPGLAYTFQPRPGYSPKSMKSKMFEKMRGKCILDKASGELAFVDAEIFDNINLAFGLAAKVTKGTKFRLTRTEAAPGIWVEQDMHARFSARFMLFKNLRQEVDTRYTEFSPRPPKNPQRAAN
ncbi:MAG: hypothetical protein JNK48_19135 [Bryobacterales bacterium]|nr:hypothetical protein [Bryobacterales bacterium]